jgi:hypothetical protein
MDTSRRKSVTSLVTMYVAQVSTISNGFRLLVILMALAVLLPTNVWLNLNSKSSCAVESESEKLLKCYSEYEDIKSNQTIGLMDDDYAKSRAYHGSIRRLAIFLEKLQSRQTPVTVVSYGGSISLGNGIAPGFDIYSNIFVKWLNAYYPVTTVGSTRANEAKTHKLYNRARGGFDVRTSQVNNNYFISKLGSID